MPIAVLNGRAHVGVSGVDPAARPTRRRFSAEYKLGVLSEYDAAADGVKGSILRVGAMTGLETRSKMSKRHPAEIELKRERRRRERAEAELARSKAALDLMGKAHALLELLSESAASNRPSTK